MKYIFIILMLVSGVAFAAPGNMDSKYVIYQIDSDSLYLRPNGNPKRIDWPVADGGPIVDGDPNIVLLEVTEGVQPTFDPATQKLERSRVVDLPNTEWRREWTVVPLTQEELDEIAQDAADDAERAQARAIYLQLKNISASDLNTNAKTRNHIILMSRVLARLIRDNYGE